MEQYNIGQKLEFPDGDIATIHDVVFYKDEEEFETGELYDAIQVLFTIDGDEERIVFDEILDSREDYKFNVMKPI